MSEQLFTPELLKNQYPEGILMYHQPLPELAEYVLEDFQIKLPDFFPLVDSFVYQPIFASTTWGTDFGSQIGDMIYAEYGFKELLFNSFAQQTGLCEEEIARLLPSIIDEDEYAYRAAENGYAVPIPGTNIVFHGMDIPQIKTIYKHQGYEFVTVNNIRQAILENKYEQDPPDGITLYSAHVDLSFTGFLGGDCIHIYMDELFSPFAEEIAVQLGNEYVNLETVPHEQALAGALNIRYLDTASGWKAVIPSKKTLGKIASRLIANGYELVELGDEQVSNGGGTKCRMIRIKWRE